MNFTNLSTCHSRKSGNLVNRMSLRSKLNRGVVMLRMNFLIDWIPAFAGMTGALP
jgi:hypothetical protein